MSFRTQLARRWLAAFVLLWAATGLQAVALPLDLLSMGSGACAMACSLSERTCCCESFSWGEDGVRHSAFTEPEITGSGRGCPSFAATVQPLRSATDALQAESRHTPSDLAESGGSPTVREAASRSDSIHIPTLPRPPPVPALSISR